MRAGTGYVVAPKGDRGGPGVLVLHSWWGLTDFFRGLCDRLADAGYVALAPDLHLGRTADRPDEAEQLLADVDVNQVASLVMASAATLQGMPITADGPIGAIGFSMGASWAMWLAARDPERIAATVAFYGMQHIDFAPARSAFLGHFAAHDSFVPDEEVDELYGHLKLNDLEAEFHRYPGTTHWFFEEDRRPAYDPGAAHLAWNRTLRFLGEHLPPTAEP